MRTFFLQLATDLESDGEEPQMLVWIGGHFDECQDADLITRAASLYASDAERFRTRLLDSQAADEGFAADMPCENGQIVHYNGERYDL